MLASELLLYLHATLHPFVVSVVKEKARQKKARGMLRVAPPAADSAAGGVAGGGAGGADDGSDEEEDLPSYLREESSDEEEAALYSKKKNLKRDRKNDVTGFKVRPI